MKKIRALSLLGLAVLGMTIIACGDGQTSKIEQAFRAASWGEEGDTVQVLEVKNERPDVDGPDKIAGTRYDVRAKVGKKFKSVKERNFLVFIADQGKHSSVKSVD